MKDKIKVGEYVRNKSGDIVKVNKIKKDEDIEDDLLLIEKMLDRTWKSMVKKHSKNIIDLIEVGDYVNGIKIYSVKKGIGYGDIGQEGIIINKNYMNCKFISKEDIKSIVTHEKFKRIEYIIE